MEVKAKVSNVRMSPRKVRLVADLVRGASTEIASGQLKYSTRIAKKPIIKLLNSAIANAVNNFELDKKNLFVKEIRVDEGATLKRWLPRAHGRATPLRKRTCQIMITLAEVKDSGAKTPKKQALEPAVKLETSNVEVADKKDLKKNAKKEAPKDEAQTGSDKEVDKKIVDPRMEGRGGHAKIEGGAKGFTGKMFRRKSG